MQILQSIDYQTESTHETHRNLWLEDMKCILILMKTLFINAFNKHTSHTPLKFNALELESFVMSFVDVIITVYVFWFFQHISPCMTFCVLKSSEIVQEKTPDSLVQYSINDFKC